MNIYHYRVIKQLYQLLKNMNIADRQALINEAASRGFNLDKSSMNKIRQSYQKILAKIRHSEY